MEKKVSFIIIALLAICNVNAQFPSGATKCTKKNSKPLSPQVLASSSCKVTVCGWYYQLTYNPRCVYYPCAITVYNAICTVCNNTKPLNDQIAAYTLGTCPPTKLGVPFNATLCTEGMATTKLKCPDRKKVCGYKDINLNPLCQKDKDGMCKQTYNNYCDACKYGSAGFLYGPC